jgi:hypothetical protein
MPFDAEQNEHAFFADRMTRRLRGAEAGLRSFRQKPTGGLNA